MRILDPKQQHSGDHRFFHKYHVLLVYLEPLVIAQIDLLNSWAEQVHYWPRSYAHTDVYNAGIPLDYWLLFHQHSCALNWILRYPDQTRVIRTLFDHEDPEILG